MEKLKANSVDPSQPYHLLIWERPLSEKGGVRKKIKTNGGIGVSRKIKGK